MKSVQRVISLRFARPSARSQPIALIPVGYGSWSVPAPSSRSGTSRSWSPSLLRSTTFHYQRPRIAQQLRAGRRRFGYLSDYQDYRIPTYRLLDHRVREAVPKNLVDFRQGGPRVIVLGLTQTAHGPDLCEKVPKRSLGATMRRYGGVGIWGLRYVQLQLLWVHVSCRGGGCQDGKGD